MICTWGPRRDFQISFSSMETSRNAWNRHWGSFMVDTGILSNNMNVPSHECYITFCDLTINNDNPLLTKLCTELDLLPNFDRFPENICDGCGMPTGDFYSSGHLVPSLVYLHNYVLLVETNPFLRTCCFSGLCSSNIPRYVLDYALVVAKIVLLQSIKTFFRLHKSCVSEVKVEVSCAFIT